MTPTPRKDRQPSKSLALSQIAELVNGEIVGDPEIRISGISGILEAEEGDITFLGNPKYLPFLEQTRASAVVTSKDVKSRAKPLVRTENPSLAFSKILDLFRPPKTRVPSGVHPSASVHPSARVASTAVLGPFAVIEKDVTIGERSVIDAGVFVGQGSSVGCDCVIWPNVTIREDVHLGDRVILHSGSVIGADGFGYETVNGSHVKIPQTGGVQIEQDVEIGAGACVDRGRFRDTVIGEGTKIDNLVQIGHNVQIGPHCMIVAQTGISGSTELGAHVVLAGQVGVVGHIRIGHGAVIGGRAGVSKSVPDGAVMLGEPARPILETKKLMALFARLPELFKDVADLRRKANETNSE